jgi:protein CpxP
MFHAILLAAHLSTASAAPVDRDTPVLDVVDATPEQRAEVRALLLAERGTLSELRERAGALRERVRALFLAPTIDRDAVEAARTDAIALLDRGTATTLELVVDLAEVFTPAQRALLQERRQAQRARWRQ